MITQLIDYRWPGNIREFQNLFERLIVMNKEDVIMPLHLPESFHHRPATERNSKDPMPIVPLQAAALESTEIELLSEAIKRYGSIRKAAQALQISPATALRKIRKYGEVQSNLSLYP